MTIVQSRNRRGTLILGGNEFACQINAVSITPVYSETGEAKETLCGDTTEVTRTKTWTLKLNAVQDGFDDPQGLIKWTWVHEMTWQEFAWLPNGPGGKAQISGQAEVLAMDLGGPVAESLTSDAEWKARNVVYHVASQSGVGKSHCAPGMKFPAEPTVTASDSTNAGKLSALGYAVTPTAGPAWTLGQKITIGNFDFHWAGSAWAAGAA